MLVLVVWAVAVGLALAVLGILGYGLYGQLNRLRRAAGDAGADLTEQAAVLRAERPGGRHRAG